MSYWILTFQNSLLQHQLLLDIKVLGPEQVGFFFELHRSKVRKGSNLATRPAHSRRGIPVRVATRSSSQRQIYCQFLYCEWLQAWSCYWISGSLIKQFLWKESDNLWPFPSTFKGTQVVQNNVCSSSRLQVFVSFAGPVQFLPRPCSSSAILRLRSWNMIFCIALVVFCCCIPTHGFFLLWSLIQKSLQMSSSAYVVVVSIRQHTSAYVVVVIIIIRIRTANVKIANREFVWKSGTATFTSSVLYPHIQIAIDDFGVIHRLWIKFG